MVGGTFGAWAIGFVAVIGGLAAGRAHGGIAAIVVGMLLVLISKRALKNDTRDRPMRLVAYRIVTTGAPASPGLTSHEPDFTGT